jgi:hypothetical protein
MQLVGSDADDGTWWESLALKTTLMIRSYHIAREALESSR